MVTPRRRVKRRVLALAALATAMTSLAACAGSNSTSSAGAEAPRSVAPGKCGSIPHQPPKDGSGVLSSLGGAVAANYNGFTQPVEASAWTKWKPAHAGPYKVAISWPPPINTFQAETLAGVKKTLTAGGKVTITKVLAPTSPADVPGQLQQLNQLIADKPDLIIAQPIAPGPSAQVIDAAAEAGIPVVSGWTTTPSASAVSVGLNNWLQAATTAAKVVQAMGGKGSVLLVHGIPGVQQDADATAGYKAVLALCPDIKVAGEVTGGYVNATTKAAVLQFLSTHPAGVNGVLQSGNMGLGVINAFQQLGKKVPPLADVGSTRGTIAYAHTNMSSYQEFGTGTPNNAIGASIAKVALKILAGQGPKVNQIITQPDYITNDTLGKIYQKGWTTTSTGEAANPDDAWMPDSYLANFFPKSAR
ncbi:substrate-binding domain-containing protein [Streptomyces sp. NPDC005799]|uniref:substrate-binding domain-containing protein n=1 Tax=Streptomyces sp. NPDC005799 TaxID=3154678 RepID=UPI00340DC7BF